MSVAESLKHVSLFAGLDDESRRSMARLAESGVLTVDGPVITFRQGEALQALASGQFREES